MPEIRVPNQGLAFLREKSSGRRTPRFDLGLPRFFKEMIILIWIIPGSAWRIYGFWQDHWPLMRTRIINQRTGLAPDVF